MQFNILDNIWNTMCTCTQTQHANIQAYNTQYTPDEIHNTIHTTQCRHIHTYNIHTYNIQYTTNTSHYHIYNSEYTTSNLQNVSVQIYNLQHTIDNRQQ